LNKINNEFYNNYGEKWYEADDDPVALLRAESLTKTPWIIGKISQYAKLSSGKQVLDVGCGAGFLCNELAKKGFQVTGIDSSEQSLEVAQAHDTTFTVKYILANAYELPFDDDSFDVVTSLDFLEHVEEPAKIIKEISRVLKPQGLFIFHTFNRNPLAYLIIIKFVEWFVKNTPKNMHVLNLFIKPQELKTYCKDSKIDFLEVVGIRPVWSSIPIKNFFTGIVPKTLRFKITNSLMLSYLGIARKDDDFLEFNSLIT